MRIGVVCVALLSVTSAVTGLGQSNKEAKPETVARWHFAGTKQLSTQKDLTALRSILSLPETLELRNVALEGFAQRMAEHFTKSTDTNANRGVTALIKPLLPDLIENESGFDFTARGIADADWALAVRIPAERQAEWSKNLTELANSARMTVTKSNKGNGWRAEKNNYRFTFSPEKEWLVLDGGFGAEQVSKRDKGALTRRSGKSVLTAELNLPKIGAIWGAKQLEHGPRLSVTARPRKGALLSEMDIDYPQPLNIKPERWNVPTDLILDPLIGFTAIQGISDRLLQSQQFQKLGAQKTPNQAFLWSQSTMSFAAFAAADVGNPAVVISNIAATYLPGLTNKAPGRVNILTNRPGIIWRGLPVAVPFIEAADEGRSPFLLAGLFPIGAQNAKPAPKELFAELNKRNLVYYDWEITQERLKQWRPMWQFVQLMQGKLFARSASEHWIDAIMPLLGNTVTEVRLDKKDRLKLVRTSQSGLTALELVLLAHALDPSDVTERRPGLGGQQPQQQRRPKSPTAAPKR